ncbi:hypothetical protein L6R50_27425, partial [Myxococcota bacterium]|nr:hypothetical protein [Myxococcota bacterium]
VSKSPSRGPDPRSLSPIARNLAEVAAAFHEPFSMETLAAVLPGRHAAADLAAGVDEVLGAGLLVPTSGELFTLRPNVREKFTGRGWATLARGVHRALGRRYAAEGERGRNLGLLLSAHTYLRDAGEAREAAVVAIAAAPLLRLAGDWERLVGLMTQAAESSQGIERLEVLARLAEALLKVQRFGEAFRLYELLLRAVGGRAEDRYRGVEAASRVALATFYFLDGSPALARGSLEAALQLRRGLRDLPGQSEALRRLAVLDLVDGDLVRAEQRAREALALARRAGTAEGEALASVALAGVAERIGGSAAARSALDEVSPAARSLGGPLEEDLAHAVRQAEMFDIL